MNPNFKKKKPLPYKNLGELYIEAVQGEPSINRFFETKDYEVYIGKRNDPSKDQVYEVDEPIAVKITRIIDNINNNTEGLIKDLLKQSGFPSDGVFFILTDEAFNKQPIDSIKLEEVIKKKESKEKLDKLFEKYLDTEGVFNIKEEVLNPVVKKFTKTPEQLIDNLFKITPPQSTIGVGPGEVCIALFTNFAKGRPGDLICDDKKIEVKANGGRVGKSGYSLEFPTYAKSTLPAGGSIVQPKTVSLSITPAVKKIKIAIAKRNTPDLATLSDYIKRIEAFVTIPQTDSKIITDIANQGEEINNSIQYRPIKLQLNNIINALTKSVNNFTRGEGTTWGQIVRDFFLSGHQLDRDQIIGGLIELRSEANTDKDVESLSKALHYIVTDETYFKESGQDKLDRITLAIQTASYQCHEKFNYLLVINKSYKAVSLKFDSADDIGASFNQMLKYIDKYSLTTNLANDSSRKAISIELP